MTLEEIFQKETKTKKETGSFQSTAYYYQRYSEWLEIVVNQLKEVTKLIPAIDEKKPWKTFYFEGNQAWGIIDSPAEWKRIKKAYVDTMVDLTSARKNPNSDTDSFGFHYKYDGIDLIEFGKDNNMDLKIHEEQCMIDINGICSCKTSLC